MQWRLADWVPRILQDSFEQRTTQPLQSKEVTLALVAEFLAKFNHTVPLVDESVLLRLVERHFSWNPDNSLSSWVLINVAIAFSYRERAQACSKGVVPAKTHWVTSKMH
jgi:hypothetical protein